MRGHIVKRYTGSYSIVLNLGNDPATGKRKQQWIAVKGTKKDAEKRMADLIHQLDTGTFMRPGKTTFAEFLERWLDEYARVNLAPRTAEGYESIAHRHLIPAFGSMTLTQIKPEHIQKYYASEQGQPRLNAKLGQISSRTIRSHHMMLHKALSTAVKWGLLPRNPADAVDPPKAQRVEMKVLDEDGVKKFLEAARATPFHALFYMALFTGLRRSELLALRWKDVDLIFGQIYVSRSVHRLRDGSFVFRNPKTAKGRRAVALPPSLALVITNFHREAESRSLLLGRNLTDEDLVFCREDGSPISPDLISASWRRIANSAGLKGIRLHDARHTHASLMLKQGVHPKIVQERLGHSSISVTLDTYSHVAQGLQDAAACRFDQGLGMSQKTPSEIPALAIR